MAWHVIRLQDTAYSSIPGLQSLTSKNVAYFGYNQFSFAYFCCNHFGFVYFSFAYFSCAQLSCAITFYLAWYYLIFIDLVVSYRSSIYWGCGGRLPCMQAISSFRYNCYKESTGLLRATIFYTGGTSEKHGLFDVVWAWFFRCGFSFNPTIWEKLSGHMSPQGNMRLCWRRDSLINSVPG